MLKSKEEFKVGDPIVRGPDWRWGNQDGGEGNIGEFVEIDTAGWCIIKWPSGESNTYEYEINKHHIMLFKPPEKIKIEKPKEAAIKVKRMDKSDFKNALKGLK